MKSIITKILAVGTMILALSFSAKAQGPRGREGFPGNGGQRPDAAAMAKMQADQMKELVKLSDEQYTKVLDVFKKSSEKMQANRGNGQQGGFNMEAMQKMQQEQDAQIKKILTEDQYKKWTESRGNRRGFGGPNGQRGPRQGGQRQGGWQ